MRRGRPDNSRAKRESWEQHLREWRRSGLSQIEYCRRQGISIKCFGYWKRILSTAGVAVTLVEVPVPRPAVVAFSQRAPLRLRITDSYWIEIENNFDPENLNQVLDVLEGR